MRVEPTLGSTGDWQALAPPIGASQTRLDADALYEITVGPRNQDHHLAKFKSFAHSSELRVVWHWPACLLTTYWLGLSQGVGPSVGDPPVSTPIFLK
jgi:hypothetical protein